MTLLATNLNSHQIPKKYNGWFLIFLLGIIFYCIGNNFDYFIFNSLN